MIIAVTGMAREARLIAHRNVLPVVGGGDADMLESRIKAAVARGGRRILSVGICGALCPELRVGDVVIASEIVTPDAVYSTNASWTRELAARIPHAVVASMTGIDFVSADRAGKADLRAITEARTVDMESHVAARAALAHGLPFAALRVVSDGAHRSLPHAAQIALHPSGGVDLPAVLRSLLRAPLQVLPLIRTAWEAEIAFAALLRCCSVLHAGFARVNLGELALDVA
jgi:hopanoid-associated phosphorylase